MRMAFKDRLKELRERKGITVEELSRALNIPESSIRRYESAEKGYPGAKRVSAIADYFGVSTDFLYERDNSSYFAKEETNSFKERLIKEVQLLDEDDAKNIYHIVIKIRK